MADILVNALGEQCPIPVVKANRALRAMTEPGTLTVLVDNPIAVENLKRMALAMPCSVESRSEKEFAVVITVSAPVGDAPLEEPPVVACAAPTTVVAVDSDTMGRGSEELGRVLMKGFLFAVSQLSPLPKTVLFYNGGAKLTVEGSASLEDIRSLAAQGVEILTCGTCLNHYGLTEQLAVGSVTNMYTIVETLAGAGKVIKP